MVINNYAKEKNSPYGDIGDIDSISKSEMENEDVLRGVNERVQKTFENGNLDALESYSGFLNITKELIQNQLDYIDIVLKNRKPPEKKNVLYVIGVFKEELFRQLSKLCAMNYLEALENDTGYELANTYMYSQVFYILEHTKIEIITSQKVDQYAVLPDWKGLFFLMMTERKNKKIFEQLPFMGLTISESNDSHLAKTQGASYVNLFHSYLARAVFYQRKRLNLTQKELALMSDVDRSSIAKIESCKQSASLGATARLLNTLHMGITIYPLGDEGVSKERDITFSLMKNHEVSKERDVTFSLMKNQEVS